MIGLTLKHLRFIEAVAQYGHFGRAAQSCAVSQPALSMQIKELEAILGAPLVERSTRQIRLTTLGEDFVDRAREILLAVDDLKNLARASDGLLSGRLRLGVIPTVAPYLLPEIIKALSIHFPKLELEAQETVTQSLIDGLLQSRLDFAIVALPISEPALQEFALFEEDFVLVRQVNDADEPVPNPDLLQKMRLLLLEEGHCFRDQALAYCNFSATGSRQLLEGSSLTTLVQMVGAGMGVTLIPQMAIPLEGRFEDISIARFASPRPTRTIGMIWRKSNPLINQLMQIGAIVRGTGQRKLDQISKGVRHL